MTYISSPYTNMFDRMMVIKTTIELNDFIDLVPRTYEEICNMMEEFEHEIRDVDYVDNTCLKKYEERLEELDWVNALLKSQRKSKILKIFSK